MADKFKFPECESCINRKFDPFECQTCEDGSNLETQELDSQENDIEELTIGEFIDYMNEEEKKWLM